MSKKNYFKTCPDCGANLDPGEICDCHKPTVAYLCDQKACEPCPKTECHHTTDINHAINFNLVDHKNKRYAETSTKSLSR